MAMDLIFRERIDTVWQAIREAELASHRVPGSVTLLAVSKGQPAVSIAAAFEAGLRHFGENYFQEAREKMVALGELPLVWHFIGPLQRNKLRAIALAFDWVHSVCSMEAAQKLNDVRSGSHAPLQICLQVNLDREPGKSGIEEASVLPLALDVSDLPALRLRGLMAIPRPEDTFDRQVASFQRLTALMDTVNHETGLAMDTLSMGMSNDFRAAIAAGSTIVRTGRAIFGERDRRPG